MYVCASMCVCLNVQVCLGVYTAEGNLQEMIFSFYHVGSRVQIQIVRLGGRPRQVPTAPLLSLTLLRYC